jgi:hypothetical protein
MPEVDEYLQEKTLFISGFRRIALGFCLNSISSGMPEPWL